MIRDKRTFNMLIVLHELYEYETSRVNGLQGKVLDALLLDGGGQDVILKLS